jgi:hypothetical protein
MYGAELEPMIWSYAWFSMTIQITWSIEVAGPLAVPHGPDAAAIAVVCVTAPAPTMPRAKRTNTKTARNPAFRGTA